jgi:oligopeptide transport system substrate-binding protein
MGWCADYPDPQNWLSDLWEVSLNARNYYSNSTYFDMVEVANNETDPVTRLNLYLEAQSYLIGDVPAIITHTTVNSYLVSPVVMNYKTTTMDSRWPGETLPLSVWIHK